MVNRRALMATAVGMGALMLSGCVPWSTQGRVNRAAESVGGVESSELDVGRGGSFSPQITGRIHCAVGASELEDVLDAAWEQVVTALRDMEGGEREVGSVAAVGDDGSELGVSRWIPPEERNYITVAHFFERYGLQ